MAENTEEKELAWMPLYWDKFLSATTHFSATEIGGYILLLSHQWKHGFIPADIKIQKKISRIGSTAILNHIRTKFLIINDKMINVVCQNIRDEQLNKYYKRADAGRKGGLTPKQKGSNALSNATQKIDNKIIPVGIIKKITIGLKEFFQPPSEYFLENDQVYFESLMMGVFSGMDQKIILKQFDEEYTFYDFKDLNHLRNSFKFIGKKIKEDFEKKLKPDTKNGINSTQKTGADKTIGRVPYSEAERFVNGGGQDETNSAGETNH